MKKLLLKSQDEKWYREAIRGLTPVSYVRAVSWLSFGFPGEKRKRGGMYRVEDITYE